MKKANDIHEETKMQSNPVYKEAVKTFEDTQKALVVAKIEQQNDLNTQKSKM